MIPIEKNIIVVDEQGNQYEATYPKRAKGLVKNGRARFIDENVICLACPPKEELEDKHMLENKSMNTVDTQEENVVPEKLPISYCLRQLERLQNQVDYINNAIKELGQIPSTGGAGESYSPGDVVGVEKAKALSDIVRCRETTNQKLITFYEKMYDDLMEKVSTADRVMDIVETAVASGGYTGDEISELISGLSKAANL